MRRACYAALTALLPIAAASLSPSHAQEVEPFEANNLNPLIQLYGLPAPLAPAPLKTGAIELRAQQDIANSFSIQRSGVEAAVLDGEIWRSTLGVGIGLSSSTRLDLRIPWVRHSDGLFDGLISDWHDWFNLPNGDREDRPEDDLLYAYQDGASALLRHQSRTSGLGDIRLSLTHLIPLSQRDAFLTMQVKLPTGDADKLTGSGAPDGSLSAMVRDSQSLAPWNLVWFGGGGITYLGAVDNLLQRNQNRWVVSSHLGGAWRMTPAFHLKAQLDHHTPVYDSDIRALGAHALQLTAGFGWTPTATTSLDLAISEDLVTTVTPDFSILAALRQRF